MSDQAGHASVRGEADIPGLLLAMKTESPMARKAAKAKLLQKGAVEVIPFLEDALRDNGDADRRNSAMEIFTGLGEDSVAALARLAADPDWEIRNFACVMLGVIGSRTSVPALLSALNDKEPNVSHAAAEALGKIGDPSAVPPLMEVLDKSDFWSAYPVIAALGNLKDERAVPRILKYLDNELLSPGAIQALGNIGSPLALDPLLNILRIDGSPLRDAAFQALMDIFKKISGDKGRIEEALSIKEKLRIELDGQNFGTYLIGVLDGSEYQLKERALIAAGIIKCEAASRKALELLEDDNLAAAALESLREIGTAALPEAGNHLKNPSGRVRQALVGYLGSLGPGPGVEYLIRMLHDDMNMIRAEAALALGRIGASEAVGDLADALEDESPEVQEAAVAALSDLPPRIVFTRLLPYIQSGGDIRYVRLAAETLGRVKADEAIRPLASLLDDPREAIREVAVKAIGRIGGENAVPCLLLALRDRSLKVAQQAVVSMGRVRDPHILQRLIKFVKDKDERFCFYAIGAMKEQGDPIAIFSLMEALRDSPRELTVAALEALGALGRKEACRAVLETARTEDMDILMVSVRTLGRIGCEKAVPLLTELLSHAHWSIRAAAAEALGRAGDDAACEALRSALKDKDVMVREIAAKALAALHKNIAARA